MKIEIECEGLTNEEIERAVGEGVRSRMFLKYRKDHDISGRQMNEEEHRDLAPQLRTIKVQRCD